MYKINISSRWGPLDKLHGHVADAQPDPRSPVRSSHEGLGSLTVRSLLQPRQTSPKYHPLSSVRCASHMLQLLSSVPCYGDFILWRMWRRWLRVVSTVLSNMARARLRMALLDRFGDLCF
jgi:hypothetical protein